MRKELRRALETALDERLPAVLGGDYKRLQPLPKGDQYLVHPLGETVYVDKSRPDLARFVCFIMGKDNSFNVELGWSNDGDFPRTTSRPYPLFNDEISELPSQGFRRIEMFVDWGEQDFYLWEVHPIRPFSLGNSLRRILFDVRHLDPEEALSLIRPLAEDALVKISAHAPAFFEALEARFGTET